MADPDSVAHQPSSTFPQTPEQFDDDPRVSFSKLDQKWILEAEDGSEFSFDQALRRWIPSVGLLALSLLRGDLGVKAGEAHGCCTGPF